MQHARWPGLKASLTGRFIGSSKWSYRSPNMRYKYTYLTYDPTYNYPRTSKYSTITYFCVGSYDKPSMQGPSRTLIKYGLYKNVGFKHG